MNTIFGKSRISSALAVSLLLALAILGIAKAASNASKAGKVDDLSGLASASGKVDSPQSFKAAKVYFRNADKRILYMVYSSAGKYQVMHLLPGSYEVSAQAKGLESDAQKITVSSGQKTTANLTLHAASDKNDSGVELVPYDQLYPAGAGRKIAERLCIRCHGPDFVPSHQWSADQWNAAIDFMSGNGNPNGAQIQPGDLSKDERGTIVQYFTANFGPDSKPRGLKVTREMPVDETKIAKAEYIERYLTPDAPGQGMNAPEYASAPPTPWGKRRVSQDVVFDQQGFVWVTDRNTPNRLCRIDPRTGDELDFVTPNPTKGIHDLMIDKDGQIWMAEGNGANMNIFDTKAQKWVAQYPMDPDKVIPGRKSGQSVVIDSKHNVYMNFIVGNGMTRWDPETKKATVTTLPTPNSFPYGVVKDSKDNIWIAEFHGGKIAKIDAETLKYSEYAPPTFPALIRRLTVDSKDNVWFGLFSAGKLERLDPNTGKVTEWNIPYENSQPYDEKQWGSKIWYSDGGQGGALIQFDPANASFVVYPAPQRTDIPMIRVANDGAIWYAPRSAKNAGVGVMYPDMTKVATLGGYGNND
jgi:virginiamycin B lyase